MFRRKIDEYLKFWFNERKTALLVTGARQIGKTFSIEQFIKNNFENVVIINFAVRTDLIDLFAELKDSQKLILNLSAIVGEKLIPKKTVIFLDEIQMLYQRRDDLRRLGKLDLNSQDIITAMKQLVLDDEYRFILSGSLLGVTIKDIILNPTGYFDEYQMYPMDFEEFLWAKGVGSKAIDYLRDCFTKKEPVDDALNTIFLNYFREYVLIGGMPEAVSAYLESNNLFKVQEIHLQIVNKYNRDITEYINDNDKKLRVRDIYSAIPSELNSKNKRFVNSHINDNAYFKKNNYNDEFIWLTFAGVAIPTYNVTEAVLPLVLASERKTLKLFMSDIGMLVTMLVGTSIREKLLKGEKEINFGAPFENVVAEELWSHGFTNKLYYYNSKKHGEVDFIIEYQNDVLPIEVKSGKTNEMNVYNHTALNNLIKMYDIEQAFVFGECNIKKETDVIYQLPIYMIMFIKER